MRDHNKFDSEAQNYFDTLPIFMQENIMQSGVQIKTKEDLINLIENSLHDPSNRTRNTDNRPDVL